MHLKSKLFYLFQSSRPNQWTKNLLVFAVPFFAFNLDPELWFKSFLTFICFCLVSSSVYLINDSRDINSDRKHPIKKKRPIPSGKISIKLALSFAIFLLLTAIFISQQLSISLLICILIYYFLQILYCIVLKNIPILDIFSIATGFLIRSISGSISYNIYLSPWFILSIGLLALFLGIEKRKAELFNFYQTGIVTRKVLLNYSKNLLSKFESTVTTSCFLTYSLWASGPALSGSSTKWMLLTVPFVLGGIFRYQQLSDTELIKDEENVSPNLISESPEKVLLKDKFIQVIVMGWLLSTFIIMIFTNK